MSFFDDQDPFGTAVNPFVAGNGKATSPPASATAPQVPKYDEVARSEPTPPPPVATPKSIVPTYRPDDRPTASSDPSRFERKNWPPCRPIVKNYISEEIPAHRQRTVRLGFFVVMVGYLTLLWNVLTQLVFWLGCSRTDATGITFLVSVLYFVVNLVFGWSWYKSLYHGCRTDNTRNHVCFFMNCFIHTLFFILGSIGVPQVSMSGIITVVSAFKCNSGYGFTALVSMLLFFIVILSTAYLLKRAHAEYRQVAPPGSEYKAFQKGATAAVVDAAWSSGGHR